MNSNQHEVITHQGGEFELNKAMRERMVAFANGEILINKNYQNDVDVINKLAFFECIILEDGSKFIKDEKKQINYVDAYRILECYDDNQKSVFFDNASMIQMEILDLIKLAFAKLATDIHIKLEAPATHIYFRILGELCLHEEWSYDDGNKFCTTLYESMTTTSGTSFNSRTQQDANINGSYLPDGLSGIRVATGPTQSGNYFMVLRLLPDGSNSTLDDLGYAKSQITAIRKCLAVNNGGLTLISGPTGSGKSRTLKAGAEEVIDNAQGRLNFLTIEDPVEYKIQKVRMVKEKKEEFIDGVSHIKEVERQVIYSASQIAISSTDDVAEKRKLYQKAVIAAMRQDPDFIMIGEIRDDITADAAITASNTGHPVLTTVHARNAQMIIDRLIKIGADRELLLSPDMINGMIAQQLIPILCPNCKQKLSEHLDLIDAELVQRLNEVFAEHGGVDGIYIRNNNSGEPSCGYYDKDSDLSCIAGYIKREVIAEIILPDVQYLQYMRERNLVDANNYWLNELDGYTMMCHGLAKVKRGLVDPHTLESKLKHMTKQENLDKALCDV